MLVGDRPRDRGAPRRATAGRSTRPPAARIRSPTSPSAGARRWRSTSPTRRRCGRRSPRSSRPRARSARSSTTPATASPGAVESVSLERLRAQFETNVFGLVRMCQLVAPRDAPPGRRAGSSTCSSMGGRMTFPGGGAYHATKYAVEALSDALRFELRGFGIQVVVIEPGLIKTRFGETAVGSIDARARPRRRRSLRELQRRGWRRHGEAPTRGRWRASAAARRRSPARSSGRSRPAGRRPATR